MSCATLKTRSSVFADCMVFPFSLVVRRRWFGSGTSSRVTSAGPIGQNVGNILPRRLCSHAWIGPITPVEEKIGHALGERRGLLRNRRFHLLQVLVVVHAAGEHHAGVLYRRQQ